MKKKRKLKPVHPGEILREDFLKPMKLTPGRLAALIDVDRRRTTDIVHGRRDITADTALRLGRLFGMEPDFWLNLPKHYELECAKDEAGAYITSRIAPLSDTVHA